MSATSMTTPTINRASQNAMSNASEIEAARMVNVGHAPDSPGTPQTASPIRAKTTMVAAIRTIATGRRAVSGTNQDTRKVNGYVALSASGAVSYTHLTLP